MHKRTHLTEKPPQPAKHQHGPRLRTNRRRRDWNRTLKVFAVCLAFADVTALLCAPELHVTRVRVDGAQTLTPQQVFDEAQVPNRTNLFWMLHQPLTRRLAADPVIDHAERSVRLPNLLILTVFERQPYAVLAGNGQFWLMDSQGVPYQEAEKPLPPLPIIQAADAALPASIVLGRPLGTEWLPHAFHLLALSQTDPDLSGAKIVVDQNLNLCLNRKNRPQIRLGQSDSLPWKMKLADAALSAYGGALSERAAYIDVSCPEQPVWHPRAGSNRSERSLKSN